MTSDCTIQGTVIESAGRRVRIETDSVAACTSCGGKALCSSGNKRMLELETRDAFTAGDRVSLTLAKAAGAVSTFFLYGAGTVIATVAVLLAYLVFNASEVTAAILFIAMEMVCFILANVGLRRYLKIKIRITPIR